MAERVSGKTGPGTTAGQKGEHRIRGVFLDLDGTLADTWEDLALAADHVLQTENCRPLTREEGRLKATDGMTALLSCSMGPDLGGRDPARLKEMFLDYYLKHIHVRTRLFPGMEQVLQGIRARDLIWGVVTNKPLFLAEPLLASFPELADCHVLIAHESVKEKKPHPAPLLKAAELAGLPPEDCLYAGDHVRDIMCGRNAGAVTAAAAWGYIPPEEDPAQWGADHVLSCPEEILHLL